MFVRKQQSSFLAKVNNNSEDFSVFKNKDVSLSYFLLGDVFL